MKKMTKEELASMRERVLLTTVKELKEELESMDDTAVVIIATNDKAEDCPFLLHVEQGLQDQQGYFWNKGTFELAPKDCRVAVCLYPDRVMK